MAGKVFLGVSVKVLPEEIDICVGGLGEEDPPPIWVSTIQSAASAPRTKQVEEDGDQLCLLTFMAAFFLLCWMLPSIRPALDIGPQVPLAFGLCDLY